MKYIWDYIMIWITETVLMVYESEVTQSCLTLWDPMYCSHQGPLSMGFPRQEYWSGLPFPSPEDFTNPGIEPGSPALWADALPSEPPGNPWANIQKHTHVVIPWRGCIFFICAHQTMENKLIMKMLYLATKNLPKVKILWERFCLYSLYKIAI